MTLGASATVVEVELDATDEDAATSGAAEAAASVLFFFDARPLRAVFVSGCCCTS